MQDHPYAPPGAAASELPRDERAAEQDAKVALALSVGALFVCAPVLAPLAIWKAVRARKVVASWPSAVAIGIAALSLMFSAVLWLLAIWQYLSPR